MKNRLPLVAAVASTFWVGTFGGIGCRPSPPAPSKRPHILLVSVDSLRADHLSCYGYPRTTSPAIDRIAKEGSLFETVISSTSWTLPAHAALFTGLPDSVHGCDRNDRILAPERATLAESLRDSGYHTAGFWSGPYLHPRFGLAQGFEEYFNCANYSAYTEESIAMRTPGQRPLGQGRANDLAHVDITSPTVLERVTKWLRTKNLDTPFFLFVHLWDVHYDFIPPAPYDTLFDPDYRGKVNGRNLGAPDALKGISKRDLEHIKALYDGEIRWTDHHLGQLLDLLDELDLKEETLVVITADHGEEFFEHGQFGHHKELFEESVKVPLVIRYPGRVEAGRRVKRVVRLVDIAPSLLEWAGADPLPDIAGESLVSVLAARAESDGPLAISELYRRRKGTLLSVRSDNLKVITNTTSGETVGIWDLRMDPEESGRIDGVDETLRNRADELLQSSLRELARLTEHHAAPSTRTSSELPVELKRQLRALGYLDEED